MPLRDAVVRARPYLLSALVGALAAIAVLTLARVGEGAGRYATFGWSDGAGRAGAVGQSLGQGAGVLGFSGTGSTPDAPGITGVYGVAEPAPSASGSPAPSPSASPGADAETDPEVLRTLASGIRGSSAAGRGIFGESEVGTGVMGYSRAGTAIHGFSRDGIALEAEGRVRFTTSDVTRVLQGQDRRIVTMPFDVTPGMRVLATLQGDAGGRTTLQRVHVDPAADTVTFVLTAPAVRAVFVSWFVIG